MTTQPIPDRVNAYLANAKLRTVNEVAAEQLREAGIEAFVSVDEPEPTRYALVQSDSGGDWYVIEADRRDEWYSTVTDEQIDAGLSWAHP